MRFPNSFLEEIKSRVSLPSVIGKRVALKRHGREYLGLCPFHKEKSPSFHVYEGPDPHYHCFGCGAHGDAISFLTDHEGLDFPEAVEQLAGEAGMAMPVATPEERVKEARRAGLYEVVEAACSWFQSQLRAPAGREALDYLRGRGLTPETMAAFRLGYAPNDGVGLRAAIEAAGGTVAQAVEAGLMRVPEDGRAPYPFFRDRVMFPILDRKSRPIAFGGRFMGDHKVAGTGKYVNSPETPLFDKGRTLYNADKAKPAARSTDRILVAEGYMDVIALAQAGIPAAVAPLGTAMGEEQIAELWRILDAPLLCFDGDAAGRNAASKAAERALGVIEPGKTLNFVFLPEGEDPDSLIRTRGREAMEAVLGESQRLEQVLWRSIRSRIDLASTDGKAAAEKAVLDMADSVTNEIVRRHLIGDLKGLMWEAIRQEREAARPAPSARFAGRPGRFGAPQNPSQANRLPNASLGAKRRGDQAILAILAWHAPLMEAHEEALSHLVFEPDLDKLRLALQNAWAESGGLDSGAWRDHFLVGLDPSLRKVLDDPGLASFYPQARADASISDATVLLDHLLDQHVRARQMSEAREVGRRAPQADDIAAAERQVLALAELAVFGPYGRNAGPAEDG